MDETRLGKRVTQKLPVTHLTKNIRKCNNLPLLSAYEMDICSSNPNIHSPFAL